MEEDISGALLMLLNECIHVLSTLLLDSTNIVANLVWNMNSFLHFFECQYNAIHYCMNIFMVFLVPFRARRVLHRASIFWGSLTYKDNIKTVW